MAVFKSIQEGSLSGWTGNNTTIPITAVDTTKAFVKCSYRIENGDPQNYLLNFQLENSTTIRLKRYNAGTAMTIFWQVIEFDSGVTVQRGSRNMNSATENVSISSVDTSKSFPIISFLNLGTQLSQEDLVQAYISSSTNLELKAYSSGSTVEVQWQVIEYDNASVQVVHDHIINAQNTNATITAVDTSKTFLVGSLSTNVAPTGADDIPAWFLSSSTNVQFYRYNTASDTLRATVYVVSITDNISVQRGFNQITSGNTTVDESVTAIDTARTLLLGGSLFHTWGTANNGDDISTVSAFTFEKVSSTLIRATRANNWNDAWVEFEIVEWLTGGTAANLLRDVQRGTDRGIQIGIQ